jgi:hypothetical protein
VGGNGRNVNYQIDGGDNNDDTTAACRALPARGDQGPNFITVPRR